MQESKQVLTKVVSLVENGRKSTKCILSPKVYVHKDFRVNVQGKHQLVCALRPVREHV